MSSLRHRVVSFADVDESEGVVVEEEYDAAAANAVDASTLAAHDEEEEDDDDDDDMEEEDEMEEEDVIHDDDATTAAAASTTDINTNSSTKRARNTPLHPPPTPQPPTASSSSTRPPNATKTQAPPPSKRRPHPPSSSSALSVLNTNNKTTNTNNNSNNAIANTIPNHRNNNININNGGIQCPNCGGRAIEQHEASGASICTDCGVVVEENAIVSSVEFIEGANGGSSSMVGQFVSATSSKAYTGGGGGARGGGRYGFSRDSRETTLANGRRRIQELASRLRLSSHFVDGAHRLFAVAVEKNFVQGRRTTHVIATCLYIACRQEKSQHMLIDFSDALQVNVYSLGTCFLKFRRLLGLKLEIIDPALYVYRFAAHLDLDDQANAVSLTALRLVARMKRDWIVAGRRPAGICAAALLIAARAHGLDKQTADVTRILRVCGMTVTTRVREFEQTPSAKLTLEQFQTVDFDAEADPPIYTKNKMQEARAKAIQQGNVALLTSGALDGEGKKGSKWRESGKTASSDRTVQYQELYANLETSIMNDTDNGNTTKTIDVNDEGREISSESQDAPLDNNSTLFADETLTPDDDDTMAIVPKKPADAIHAQNSNNIPDDWKEAYPKIRGNYIVMPHEATTEEQQPAIYPTEAKLSLAEWKRDLPASIDQEIDDFFRSEEEEQQKEAIFNKINKDYIVQQERKEKQRLHNEAADKEQEADDMAQAAGQARYKDSRSKKQQQYHHQQHQQQRSRDASNKTMGGESGAATTTEDQLRAAVAARKVSRKINYDALSSIFDDDGSFATDSGAAEDDNMNNGGEHLAGSGDLMFENM